jgi:tRNA(fMet)-specific endonuclease VapC
VEDIAIPSIVAHEIYYGAFKSQKVALNVAVFDAMGFTTLDFDRDDARQAGLLRAELAARGTPIGPYDVLIAGQALARDLILVTHNTREFSRVPGLRIEDWEA